MKKINRIVLMGSSQFAVPTLEWLLQKDFELVGVYTQPPRIANRGRKISPTPIQVLADENNLQVITPLNFTTAETIDQFENLQPDIVIVVSYGLILPRRLLGIPRLGFLNIHPSLLPRWRGAAPIERTLMAGDTKTGVCIIKVEEKLDAGPIYVQQEIAVEHGMTASDLSAKLARIGVRLVDRVLDDQVTLEPAPQSKEGITYAAKIDKAETKIDWHRSAQEIQNMIHGLSIRPGAWLEHHGVRIKILKCELAAQAGKPGQVVDNDMTLACGIGSIRPTMIQRQGKSPMSRPDFMRGYKLVPGEILK